MTIFDAIRTKNNFLNLLIGLIPLILSSEIQQ